MSHSRLTILENGFTLGGYLPRALDASAQAPSGLDGDRRFMAEALLEAMAGNGLSNPNPTVGAVIVKDGRIVARGHTQAYGSFHAERFAVMNGKPEELRGATCYVTLEPCGGAGKTVPCADALIAAGLARVVVGTTDPHPKAAGLGLAKLQAAGLAVTLHGLEAEAKAWHFPFLASVEKKAPVIIGKWAQTLDGHLADDRGVSQWISGPSSRAYAHWLRQKYDAIMIGAGTLLADKPRLTARDSVPPHHRHPHKVVYDPKGALLGASDEVWRALLDSVEAQGPKIFWCTEPGVKADARISAERTRIVQVPAVNGLQWPLLWAALQDAYAQAQGYPLLSILVEGGATLLTELVRADELDACHIFVRAGILGGEKNRIGRLNKGDNPSLDLMQRRDYRLLTTQMIHDDMLVECVKRSSIFV